MVNVRDVISLICGLEPGRHRTLLHPEATLSKTTFEFLSLKILQNKHKQLNYIKNPSLIKQLEISLNYPHQHSRIERIMRITSIPKRIRLHDVTATSTSNSSNWHWVMAANWFTRGRTGLSFPGIDDWQLEEVSVGVEWFKYMRPPLSSYFWFISILSTYLSYCYI